MTWGFIRLIRSSRFIRFELCVWGYPVVSRPTPRARNAASKLARMYPRGPWELGRVAGRFGL